MKRPLSWAFQQTSDSLSEEEGSDLINSLIFQFERSPEFEGFSYEEGLSADLALVLELAWLREGVLPQEIGPENLYRVLHDWFPQTVLWLPENTERFVAAVKAYLNYAKREWQWQGADACLEVLTPEFPTLVDKRLEEEALLKLNSQEEATDEDLGYDLSREPGVQDLLGYNLGSIPVLERAGETPTLSDSSPRRDKKSKNRRKKRNLQKKSRKKNR